MVDLLHSGVNLTILKMEKGFLSAILDPFAHGKLS